MVALTGSMIALSLASHIKRADGSFSTLHTLVAGVSLGGIGVWAAHFIGMMALKLDMANSYALVETGLSMVIVIAASSLALGFVARGPKQMNRKILAGSVLGLSVATMHYVGMYGMRFGGYIDWDYAYIATSIVIAVVAATVALHLSFQSTTPMQRFGSAGLMAAAISAMHYTGMYGMRFGGYIDWDYAYIATSIVIVVVAATVALHLSFQSTTAMQRFGSAGLMAAAISAMHYTGMAAANFVCTTENRTAFQRGFGYVTAFEVPSLVTVAVVSMLTFGIILLMFQPLQSNRRG